MNMTTNYLKVSGVGQGLLGYDVLTDAEVHDAAVAQWGEDVVAANTADVARRFDRPRKDEPFHPVTNTGDKTLTITHTHEAGTMVEGTARGDGSAEVLKTCGWRWSRNLGTWYIPQSRDRMSSWRIDRAALELRAAGFEVDVQVDDTYRSTAEVEAGKIERQANRVDALEAKADKITTQADALDERAHQMGEAIPYGQPVMGARDRAYRDRMHALDDRAHVAYGEAADATQKAEAASHTTAGRYSVVTVANRIAKIETEIRRVTRILEGTDNRLKTAFSDAGAAKAVEMTGGCLDDFRPAWGVRLERYTAELADQTDQLTYWTGVRAEQVASGQATDFSKATVHKGDAVFIRGGWRRVVRANAKTVSCETGYSWTDSSPYAEIKALKTAAEVATATGKD